MIDLEERARSLNEHAVTPMLPIEVVVQRARRIRARRRMRAIAAIGSVAALVLVVAMLQITGAKKRVVVIGPGPTTPTSAPAPHAVAPPARFIAHLLQGGSAQPGKVVIIDTATGKTIRAIGADYDPYLANGFAIARGAGVAFWTRLNEPAQTLELVEVPLAGGTPRVLTSSGSLVGPLVTVRPGPLLTAVDPAGSRLWMNGKTMVDLATGTQQPVAAPPVAAGWSWETASWLPGGHELFMVEGRELPATCFRDGGPLGTPRTTLPPECITTPASRSRDTRGLVYDLSNPRAGWHAAATPARPEGWSGLRALGPGRLPSTVVVVGSRLPSSTGSTSDVMTVDVNTGAIVDQLTLAADANVLTADASGTNFLFTTNRLLERVSFADPHPVVIRRQVGEAAW